MRGTSFNAVMNLFDVSLQRRSIEHLRTERAMFAHIFVNFLDVPLQIRSTELLRTKRGVFAHLVMNFIDMSCQLVER